MIRQRILGPPGTGKTTRMLQIVDEAIGRGIPPLEIAFVAFTKVAATEAVNRAMEKFGGAPADYPFFRTLHSLAYRLLGLRRDEVMQAKHYAEFAAANGWDLTAAYSEETPTSGSGLGDQLLRCYQLARARRLTTEQEWQRGGYEFPDWLALKFTAALKEYKRDTGLFDFSDFIDGYEGQGLPVKVLIVDEAQDLTAQQWAFVDRVSAGVPEIYVAGDDDQAIYEWAAADVTHFMRLNYETEVLPVSYRLPENIRQFGDRVVSGIKDRLPKQWRGRPGGVGRIDYQGLSRLEIGDGEWLLLGRTNLQLTALAAHARDSGRAFSVNGRSSIDQRIARGILAYTALSRGNQVSSADATILKACVARLVGKSGEALSWADFEWPFQESETRPPWYEAFTALTVAERTYYRALLRRGERLDKPPGVRVATVHTAKGAQAQNVLVMATPSVKAHPTQDDERRVWYVAVTRASERLVIANAERNVLFR